eukprot:TRINITY_DN1605_c0_g1_i6.p1 TRINITY_DN1605_c0_g1~~TRINITY_DN1605_c0_g1_i6.p1  ORF type:complete len:408 (+),score=45.21 TRINITY_DN1605_c0_g1_i6:77-1300(+)
MCIRDSINAEYGITRKLMVVRRLVVGLGCLLALIHGHGQMTFPLSRNGGNFSAGADCADMCSYWFSNNIEIPGPATLPPGFRTGWQNLSYGSVQDEYRKNPWRAPGTAVVYGSGCGVAGGSHLPYDNGGFAPPDVPQGTDSLTLPPTGESVIWHRGTDVEVAFAIIANHGGGYSWRLCPSGSEISEECFQKTPLAFSQPKQSWVAYKNGTRLPIPSRTVTQGTMPEGSEWKTNPIPSCRMCDPYDACGVPLVPTPDTKPRPPPNGSCWHDCVSNNAAALRDAGCPPVNDQVPKSCFDKLLSLCRDCGNVNGTAWQRQEMCMSGCSGGWISLLYGDGATGRCPDGTSQFEEPIAGLSGLSVYPLWDWSVLDHVKVPATIQTGNYVLSWRWDCEHTAQVWQNCADVIVV